MLEPAEILRYLAATHVLLALALLLRDYRNERTARATAAFLVSLLGYLFSPILLEHGAFAEPVFAAAYAVPFAFWLLARSHFDDDFRLELRHGAYPLGLLAAHYWARESPSAIRDSIPRLLGAALVLDALYRVYVGAQSDLVEPRRELRNTFLGISGFYALAVLLGEVVLRQSPLAPLADAVNATLVYLTVFGFSFVFLSLGPALLRRKDKRRPSVSSTLLEKLRRLVAEEKVYREPGLTVRKLAKHLGEPEHLVRQVVNAGLGFKNFNAFLNHYRVEDARAALSDPKEARNVAEIAYSLGYQSLGPFNKAFRELTGKTPRELRKTPGSSFRAD